MKFLLSLALSALMLTALVGCGGGKFVPVSGVVSVDGKPYKNAVVSFQPIGDKGNANPGIGSSAITDDDGKFKLTAASGQAGAVPGKHKVRIQTNRDKLDAKVDLTVGSSDSDPGPSASKTKDPIPPEWYSDTGGVEFDVPAGGTDKADFKIETRKKK